MDKRKFHCSSTSTQFLVRHQVDLIDMEKSAVQTDGETYRFILTVEDVFSPYIWLRPLQRKSSKLVAEKLREIYTELDPPRVLQSDNRVNLKDVLKHSVTK
mgnify:CR=1 FL=1